MGTRSNIAYLVTNEDRRKKNIRFDPSLIVHRYYLKNPGLPELDDIPYRSFDLGRVKPGKVIRICCQFDGYVKGGVGQTLIRDFDTPEKALNLVLGGNCENICAYQDDDGTWRGGYQNWAMSGRDRGQTEYKPQDLLFRVEERDFTEEEGSYMYLFMGDRWWVHMTMLENLKNHFPNNPEIKNLKYWIPVSDAIRDGVEETIEKLEKILYET